MKYMFTLILILLSVVSEAQTNLDLSAYNKNSDAKISVKNNILAATWPIGKNESGKLLLDLTNGRPLFKSI